MHQKQLGPGGGGMQRKELILKIAEKAGISVASATRAIDAATEIIIESAAAGETIQIMGFGKFFPATRKARNAINPQTMKTVYVPTKIRPAFKPGSKFIDAVAKNA